MASKSKWNQPNGGGRAKVPPPRTRLVAWAAVGVAFAAAVFLVARFMLTDDGADTAPVQAGKPKHITAIATNAPSKAGARDADPRVGKALPPPSAGADEWNSSRYPGERILSVTTNRDHIVELTVKPDGTRTRHIVTPPPIWKTSTDGLLAMILTTPPGQEIPPLPDMGAGMDEEFMASLSIPIEILPDDSDEVVAMKKIVMSAREEVRELLANGEHFCDIVADHHALCNENGRIRGDAIRELAEISRSGDIDGAREYCIRMNAAFSQMGIAPIGDMDGLSGGRLNIKQRRKAMQ